MFQGNGFFCSKNMKVVLEKGYRNWSCVLCLTLRNWICVWPLNNSVWFIYLFIWLRQNLAMHLRMALIHDLPALATLPCPGPSRQRRIYTTKVIYYIQLKCFFFSSYVLHVYFCLENIARGVWKSAEQREKIVQRTWPRLSHESQEEGRGERKRQPAERGSREEDKNNV